MHKSYNKLQVPSNLRLLESYSGILALVCVCRDGVLGDCHVLTNISNYNTGSTNAGKPIHTQRYYSEPVCSFKYCHGWLRPHNKNVCHVANWWETGCTHTWIKTWSRFPTSLLTSGSLIEAVVWSKPRAVAILMCASCSHWLKFPAPCGPGGPGGPWGPDDPTLPALPLSPLGPKSPFCPSTPSVPFFPGSPFSPWPPASPFIPSGPAGPDGPWGPWSPFEPLKPGRPVAPCNLPILWIYRRRIKENELCRFSTATEKN